MSLTRTLVQIEIKITGLVFDGWSNPTDVGRDMECDSDQGVDGVCFHLKREYDMMICEKRAVVLIS